MTIIRDAIVGGLIKAVAEHAAMRAGLAPGSAGDIARDIVADPPPLVRVQAAEAAHAIDSMPGAKPMLASMTLQGAGVVILTSAAQVLSIFDGGVSADEWQPLLLAVGAIVGGVVTAIGRIRAKKPVK